MKRLVAAPLWFLVGWYAGSVTAWALGLGAFVAPITALGLMGFVLVDPLGLFWKNRTTATTPRPEGRAVALPETHTA